MPLSMMLVIVGGTVQAMMFTGALSWPSPSSSPTAAAGFYVRATSRLYRHQRIDTFTVIIALSPSPSPPLHEARAVGLRVSDLDLMPGRDAAGGGRGVFRSQLQIQDRAL